MAANPVPATGLARAPSWLRWLAVLPAAVLAPIVAGVAIDVLLAGAELSPIAAWIRSSVGPEAFGQLIQSFVAPLTFIWAGAQVAPARRRAVGIVLAVLYLAYTVWQFAGLAQAGVTPDAIGQSGRAGLFVALEVLNVLGFAVGIYITSLRKAEPAVLAPTTL